MTLPPTQAQRIADAVHSAAQRACDAVTIQDAVLGAVQICAVEAHGREDFNEVRQAFKVRASILKYANDLDHIEELLPLPAAVIAACLGIVDHYTQPQTRGRPWGVRRLLNESMKHLRVGQQDRKDILSTLGFIKIAE